MNRLLLPIRNLVPNNRFVRNVSVLAGGTAAGQLIVIAASPILTRLYTPEDFGLLAVYAGILGILGVIASLRYQLAIPLPESDQEAASIAVLSLLVVLITTFFTAVAVYFFGDHIIGSLNTPGLGPYLWLVPLGLFLVGAYQVFQFWAIRTKEFSNIARTRFTQSLGMVITQVAGYSLGPIALLLGRVVGQGAGVLALTRSAFKTFSKEFLETTFTSVKSRASEYKHFPMVSIWTGLASSGGSNLPPLLIAASLGVGPAGIYSLAHRVLSQPMAIIGAAVGDVFYRQAAESNRDGTLGRTVERVYSSLAMLALPPALAAFLLIPDIFVFVFGDNWSEAGEVGRWMIPWLFFQLVVTPSTRIYPILGLHGVALKFQLSFLCSTVFSVLVGGWVFNNLVTTVALISTINSFVYIWRSASTFELVGLKRRRAFYALLKAFPSALLGSFPIIVLMIFYDNIFNSGLVSLFLVSTSCVLLLVLGVFNSKKVLS
ncbi:lipopolysaccharide biosynthesis protein [Marinobacter sp. GN3S48]|uniref:lipopolysaccharide biosynthesis protein n=1 Tax=Marinobacter sp. GN3S48 TaxID=3382302 RepID=UPI00387AA6C8